jgi:hypothetical protein
MVPEIIFIIPYRNRPQYKFFFDKHIKHVLEDLDSNTYEIYYAEQCDERPFNRGAMKNIGFMALREKYKNHYKDITFVFNDVDCIPYTKNIINYKTKKGIVKHFYGHLRMLGGIISITGNDFENLNGFPNFWTWGYEDNVLQKRADLKKLYTDRTTFFKISDPNILHFFHGVAREHDPNMNPFHNTISGIDSIENLNYTIHNNIIRIIHFTSIYDILPDKNMKLIDISKHEYVKEKQRLYGKKMNMQITR